MKKIFCALSALLLLSQPTQANTFKPNELEFSLTSGWDIKFDFNDKRCFSSKFFDNTLWITGFDSQIKNSDMLSVVVHGRYPSKNYAINVSVLDNKNNISNQWWFESGAYYEQTNNMTFFMFSLSVDDIQYQIRTGNILKFSIPELNINSTLDLTGSALMLSSIAICLDVVSTGMAAVLIETLDKKEPPTVLDLLR